MVSASGEAWKAGEGGWSRARPWAAPAAAVPAGLLFLLCGLLFFYGLGTGDLYRTESLRALIGAEFLREGNWILPRLYGAPLLTKPPGMYAAIALASWPSGAVSEWSARLPSAMAATALVFLLFAHVRRQVGTTGGLIAAAVAPCATLWLEKATAAEIDMLHVAWVGASLLCFFRAVELEEAAARPGADRLAAAGRPEAGPRRSTAFAWWLAALLCVAGGVLTKWTTPVFFYGAALPFLAWRRRLGLLLAWPHLAAAALGAALCLAWAGAALAQVGWPVFVETLQAEALPRVTPGSEPLLRQLLRALRHPAEFLLVGLPWSAFALLALRRDFIDAWDEPGRRLVQAFHCWTWPNLILWAALPERSLRYSFPVLPGLTGLAALVWLAYLTGRLPAPLARPHRLLAAVSLALFAAGWLAAPALSFARLPAPAGWIALALAAGALFALAGGYRGLRLGRGAAPLAALILMWGLARLGYVHLYLPHQERRSVPRARAAVLARTVPPGEVLYLRYLQKGRFFDVTSREGLVYYYRRPVAGVARWADLPRGDQPLFCLATEEDVRILRRWPGARLVREIELRSARSAHLYLIILTRRATAPPFAPPEAGLPPTRRAGAGRPEG